MILYSYSNFQLREQICAPRLGFVVLVIHAKHILRLVHHGLLRMKLVNSARIHEVGRKDIRCSHWNFH